MKNQIARKSLQVALLTGLLAGLSTSSHAATFYLTAAGSGNTNFNVTTNYNSAADGSGTAPAAMAGNDFIVNNSRVDGTGSGSVTFGGNSLTLDTGTLNLRNGGVKTVASLITLNSSVIQYNSATQTLATTTFANSSGTTTFTALGTNLTTTLTLGTLSGAGNFVFGGGTTIAYSLDATSASGFSGSMTIGGGTGATLATLSFGSGITTGGSLIATNLGSRITLNQNITLGSATFAGTTLTAGSYSFATLNSMFDTIFTDGGSGSITIAAVPEPSTCALMLGGLGALFALRRKSKANV